MDPEFELWQLEQFSALSMVLGSCWTWEFEIGVMLLRNMQSVKLSAKTILLNSSIMSQRLCEMKLAFFTDLRLLTKNADILVSPSTLINVLQNLSYFVNKPNYNQSFSKCLQTLALQIFYANSAIGKCRLRVQWLDVHSQLTYYRFQLRGDLFFGDIT